jgi:starch-binding outer membrane protein SusE/F
MKKLLNKLFLISTATCLFYACKKDEVKTFLKTGAAPTLTASKTTLVLTSATATDTIETFSWTPSNYGYTAAVRYTLQIAKGGSNFAAPREISMGNGRSQKYTTADFNELSIILGLPPGSAGQLDVRVKSSISDSVTAIYSNKITVLVTPYLVIINYPSLWVPGDYQGWDPPTAPKISSKAANGIYEGFVNIAAGTLKFKYTSAPDWNHTSYGWASSTTSGNNVSGTFNSTGGDLFVPTTGYFLLKANTNNNTWSATKTTWSIIGSAPTLSNNWVNDVPLTYDAVNKVWSVTTTFIAGAFKFRANNDWAINFGDTGADLSLEYNGADILIAAPGTYTIKLDLKPGNYNYSKQ